MVQLHVSGERESVNTIIVCSVQCLQAVRRVPVTWRGGPTTRVWRERVSIQS